METPKLISRSEHQELEQDRQPYNQEDELRNDEETNYEDQELDIMGGRQSHYYTIRFQQSVTEKSASVPTTEDHSWKLPNELLLEIFGYIADLNSNPQSVLKFSFEPSMELTRSTHQPLKILSLVCQRWRHILLPDVFRHVRVTLTRRPRWVCLCTLLETEIKSKGLRGRSQHSNSIIKSIHARVEISPERATTSKNPENPMDLEYAEDDEHDLLSLPRRFLHWLPSIQGEVDAFVKFVSEKELQTEIKSLVLQTDRELTAHLTGIEETIIVREVNILWKTFLATLNLSRLIIAAPPSTMAALTSSRDSPDTWAFEMPLHYLCFSTEGSESKDMATSPSRPSSSDSGTTMISRQSSKQRVQISPQNLCSWTHIAYNEGTMLPGYAHYEWQIKLPPRVLPCLLNFMRRELKCERSPNLQSFEYISNFPYSYHVQDVMRELAQFRGIRVLKVKFAEPDYLDDTSRLGKGQVSDVWKEWEYSYKRIVTRFLQSAEPGTVFESVDAKQTEMWKDVDKILRECAVLRKGDRVGGSFLRTEVDGEDRRLGRRVLWVRREDPRGWGRNV